MAWRFTRLKTPPIQVSFTGINDFQEASNLWPPHWPWRCKFHFLFSRCCSHQYDTQIQEACISHLLRILFFAPFITRLLMFLSLGTALHLHHFFWTNLSPPIEAIKRFNLEWCGIFFSLIDMERKLLPFVILSPKSTSFPKWSYWQTERIFPILFALGRNDVWRFYSLPRNNHTQILECASMDWNPDEWL